MATKSKAAGASAASQAEARFGGKALSTAIVVAAVLTAFGIVCWGVQLSGGMIQTGMRNLVPWGFYLTNFMFFVGLSAGGLIISSIPNAFGMRGFGPISKIAIWTAICCTCVAMAFVVVDLGGPLRMWELFLRPNFTSPLMWDIIVLTTYLVISIVYLIAYLRHEAGKMSYTAIRVISVVALIVAVLVHSVTAWIFALGPAHEFWHTALMGPWFVASALDCGTAIVLIVVIALRRLGYLDLEQANVVNLAKMLGVFVCVDLYFFGCDLLTSGYFQGEGAKVVALLVSGELAPFFWTQMACMAVALVMLFSPKLRTSKGVVIASALVIAGVFCKRCQIMLGGFQIANLDVAQPVTAHSLTGWDAGFTTAYQSLVYWPTTIEFGVSLGVLAMGALILLLGIKYLPLRPAGTEE